MICLACAADGLTSRVTYQLTITALAGVDFYDEQGRYHSHDPNVRTAEYACSNGHRWHAQHVPPKCWCGWSPAGDGSTR